MWLGQVTLARNRPLLQRRLDLKELVFWGYETGRLIAVCSFVAKVLEGCRDSVIFRPPNPWVMAVLGVLRDLYETEDLKMNIKFEVQVLCKNINISIDSIPLAGQIMLCSPPVRDREGRAPDFNVKRVVAGADGSSASPPGSSGSSPSLGGQPAAAAAAVAAAGAEQPVIPNLGSYIVVNAGLVFFQKDASRRRLVTLAVDRAIREVIGPAADSAANIAVTTTRVLVLKDFALEPSEAQLRKAAQLMVSQMASNFAQATCREQLRSTIERKLRSLVTGAADQATVDQVVHVCASENLELGCALVEKAAVEKALRDVEVAFGPAYEARRKAREAGRAFRDDATYQENAPANQTIFNELPEGLGPSARGLLPHQQAVYEHFKHLRAAQPAALPANAPAESKSAGGSPQLVGQQQAAAGSALSTGQALEAYQIVLNRLDNSLLKVQQQAQGRDVSISMLGGDHEIMALLRDVIMVTQRVHTSSRFAVAMTFFETIFKRVVSEPKLNVDPLRIDVMVGAMEALRDACGGPKRFQPDMSAWLLRHATFNVTDDANRRVHLALLLRLIRSKLLKAQEADLYLAAQMDDGRHLLWLELSLALVRQCLVDGLAATYEFSSVFDTVSKARPPTPAVRKQLELWLTDLRAIAASKDEQKPDGAASQQGGVPLPPSMQQQQQQQQQQGVPPRAPGAVSGGGGGAAGISKEVVTDLLERWLRIWTSANEQVFAQYLQAMHGYGVLKTIDAADRFFRAAVEVSSEAFESKTAQSRGAPPVYTVMDALSRLFLLLMRLADKEAGAAQLLARILTAVSSAMAARTELALSVPGAPELDQRPYFRVISNLMQDLGEVSASIEPKPRDLALVVAYSQLFLNITPQKLPQFAFSWISLISHRRFLPQLLTGNAQKGWPTMHRLLLTLLSFLEPFLRSAHLTEPVRKLYDATVRILLVVLHDFPEFLSDYHASLCNAIPTTCVQLRNLVLSAFPRAMRLPDPFSTALRVDELEAMKLAPRIVPDYSPALGTVLAPLDSFLGVKNAAGQDPPSMSQKQAREFLYSLSAEIGADGAYSLSLLNAVVMHAAVQGGKVMAGGGRSAKDCPPIVLLTHLTLTLGPEGRYHLLNAMTNQLRYPNSHTHFFRFALLHLFQHSPMPDTDVVQEQITRVMLERLIVHRPHPWGLLTTFIELIKNPKFNFWKHRFTHGTPEIEKVFDTVARSCIGTSAAALEAAARGGTSS
jgi:CCR4-NOT transcription complex subunit 1